MVTFLLVASIPTTPRTPEGPPSAFEITPTHTPEKNIGSDSTPSVTQGHPFDESAKKKVRKSSITKVAMGAAAALAEGALGLGIGFYCGAKESSVFKAPFYAACTGFEGARRGWRYVCQADKNEDVDKTLEEAESTYKKNMDDDYVTTKHIETTKLPEEEKQISKKIREEEAQERQALQAAKRIDEELFKLPLEESQIRSKLACDIERGRLTTYEDIDRNILEEDEQFLRNSLLSQEKQEKKVIAFERKERKGRAIISSEEDQDYRYMELSEKWHKQQAEFRAKLAEIQIKLSEIEKRLNEIAAELKLIGEKLEEIGQKLQELQSNLILAVDIEARRKKKEEEEKERKKEEEEEEEEEEERLKNEKLLGENSPIGDGTGETMTNNLTVT